MYSTLMFKANALMFKGMMLANALLAEGEGDSSWTIGKFVGNLQKSVTSWVKVIVLIIGVVMVGFGIYQVAKNLISHGKGQTNWIVTFALIIIGGTLMLTTGWEFIGTFSKGTKGSLEDMGEGTADTATGYDNKAEDALK